LTGNSAYYFPLMLAAASLGGRMTPLHPLGSIEDHAFILADSQAKVFAFTAGLFEAKVEQTLAALEDKPELFALGTSGLAPDLLQDVADRADTRLAPTSTADDPIVVIYSSGTTGKPKGILQRNRSAVEMLKLGVPGWQLPHENFHFLAVTPVSHASQAFIIPALMAGGTVYLDEGFEPDRFCRTVEERRITVTFAVPTMIYALLDSGAARRYDMSSLQTIVYGAAPMSPSRLAQALEVFGPVFVQMYGQAEAPAALCSLRKDEHDLQRPHLLASCGRPIPGVRVEILDDDDIPVPVGSVGEICARGPLVSEGYWRRPEETAALFRNGWLHTGDMAYADDDGFFYIVDRKKDMIITGGMNVFPREVEDTITEHPAVRAVAVVGVPDDKWGEAVKAVVVLHPDEHLSEADLIAFVRERKGPVLAPKSVDFVAEIPLTPIAKPDRKALRARYWAGQARQVH
jgi:fatty-acyl-CoA synthase